MPYSLIKRCALIVLVTVLAGCGAVDKSIQVASKAVHAITPDFILPGPDEIEPEVTAASEEAAIKIKPAIRREYELALQEMQDGDIDRAIASFSTFVNAYPEYPGAALNLAKLQLKNGQTDEALATLENCLVLHPDYAAAYNQMGIVFREQGDFDKSADAYLNAIDADPEYALAYFNMGVLNDLYRQQPVVALDYYQQYRSRLGPEAEDAEVDRWIGDLQRRVGTANTEAVQ